MDGPLGSGCIFVGTKTIYDLFLFSGAHKIHLIHPYNIVEFRFFLQ